MENQGLSVICIWREPTLYKRKTPYPQKREKTKTNNFQISVETIQGIEEKTFKTKKFIVYSELEIISITLKQKLLEKEENKKEL